MLSAAGFPLDLPAPQAFSLPSAAGGPQRRSTLCRTHLTHRIRCATRVRPNFRRPRVAMSPSLFNLSRAGSARKALRLDSPVARPDATHLRLNPGVGLLPSAHDSAAAVPLGRAPCGPTPL